MIRTSSLFLALAASTSLSAQVPAKCLEIERILVDACISSTACPGSQEGQNEMVLFRVGPQPIGLGDLDVDWPNNSFNGLVQNSTSASVTATLNASVTACGLLLEPPNGVMPAGASVLLITSTAMCTQANSFAGLSDTLYVVFQQVGNTAGHFANQNNGGTITTAPSGGVALRTLVITRISTNCADTVTYDRQELVNTFGTYGGTSTENDGATVGFTWPGTPQTSYTNPGCQAPVVNTSVTATAAAPLICPGGTVSLTGNVAGSYTSLQWSGGTGTFSNATDSLTTYTTGSGDAGAVTLFFCAVMTCGPGVCDSVILAIGAPPLVSVVGSTVLCTGGTLTLTASGADTYAWSTGATSAAISVNAAGPYTVAGSNACGVDTTSVQVVPSTPLIVSISGDLTLCPGANTVLTASPGVSFAWSTGATTQSITVSTAGSYQVQVGDGCSTGSAQATVTTVAVDAAFTALPVSGPAPLVVAFTNTSIPASATWDWAFGDGSTSNAASPTNIYTGPGSYTTVLTVTAAGCTAEASITIVVEPAPQGSPSVFVPNVFSPNGDGQNDQLVVITNRIRSLNMAIYNRWGQEVSSLKNVDERWDGRTGSGIKVVDGTYFYVLQAVADDGSLFDRTGSITVLR